MWTACHIRKGKDGFEVSFYGNGRLYDAIPDGVFRTLKEAKDFAQARARFVNVIECPPKGF